jgi:magnesium-dependent phosphatase 1
MRIMKLPPCRVWESNSTGLKYSEAVGQHFQLDSYKTSCLCIYSTFGFAVMPLPRIIVFDLDACCWTPELYQIGRGAPFKYDGTKCEATASGGDRVRLLGDVRSIWGELHSSELWRQTDVAIASRCDEPKWARELLSKFEVLPGVTMIDVANPELVQIHSGNKKTHFAEISKSSGVAYADMLFFDDDPWNIEQVHCFTYHQSISPMLFVYRLGSWVLNVFSHLMALPG